MPGIDFKKEFAHLYNPSSKQISIVDVPPMQFLMIDGHGDPNGSAFMDAMNALYSMAYGIKFALKPQGVEFVVPPLEALWWVADMSQFGLASKSEWDWTAMIMQPDSVTAELVERVRAQTAAKKELPALGRLRLDTYHEGLAVQILYIGPYADEHPTIARLHAFAQEQGYVVEGKHHEIYLGDPRRTAPEKLRTVIRQPVRRG
jgi:hypothetical protein